MKILWFSPTGSLYGNSFSFYGGGWVASLEKIAHKIPNLELAIAFEHKDSCFKAEKNGVSYYPIDIFSKKLNRIRKKFNFSLEEKLIIPHCIKIIDDFKPDAIHIFGSEWCWGLIQAHTNIPSVIHIQGSIPPYDNAKTPGIGFLEEFFSYKLYRKIEFIKRKIFNENKRAKREERILSMTKYFMGRTEWDLSISKIYAPNSKYFYCSEALRENFAENTKRWSYPERQKIIILTIGHGNSLKGIDVVLKTAKLLKERTDLDFEWRLIGIKDVKNYEKITNIKTNNVNVVACGALSADELKNELLNANICAHPSYADNSPNAVCEAQILGLPVVASYVGGISSLIEHKFNGLLAPANDPWMLASYILKIAENRAFAEQLGKNAFETASKRHNSDEIISDLMNIYQTITEKRI